MNQPYRASQEEIQALLALAEENLKIAQMELNESFIRGAISKAYYAFLNAARAALLSKNVITRSRGLAVAKFGEIFVKPGFVGKDYGRWFNRALRARQEADYEALKKFTPDEAREIVEQAEKFIFEVSNLIKPR